MKKTFIIFLTLSFLNYLFSCYSSDLYSSSEIEAEDGIITDAFFPDGNVIRFDQYGGEYNIFDMVISGTSEGKEFLFPLEHLREIRTNIIQAVPLEKAEGQKITEVIDRQNKIYIFDENGGLMIKSENIIRGEMYDGSLIDLKLDLIKEIHTDRPILLNEYDIEEANPVQIKRVITIYDEVVTFDETGIILKDFGVISGVTEEGESVFIDINKILYVKVSTLSTIGSCLLAGSVVGFLLVLVLAIQDREESRKTDSTSCPFIYSYNGSKYNLDAQPLGGAITKGLMRSDYSELSYLREQENRYKLLITNEMPETQHIDELKLFAVDHPFESQVFSDLSGNFYLVSNPWACLWAKNEKEVDISSFFAEQDNIMWQTKLPVSTKVSGNKYRNHLTFAFPKPNNAKTAKLIVNAGTSLWGSNIIKALLDLYGNGVDQWYNKIDNMEKKDIRNEEAMKFIVNEELYYLKINVKEKNGWNEKGLIFGGGPFVNETHIYNIDISNAVGDTLFIQLNPPFGFWSIDYLAVDYENYSEPVLMEANISDAFDNYGKQIVSELKEIDEDYYVMGNKGDYAFVEFESLQNNTQFERTFFIKTSGYYEIHLLKDSPIQTETLNDLLNNPGRVVEFSMKLFNKRFSELRKSNYLH